MAGIGTIRRLVLRREQLSTVLASSGPLLGLALLVIAFAITAPYFLTISNFFNVFQQVAVLSILALGQTAVIIAGGIDLSVGSVLALSGIMAGWTFHDQGQSMVLAVVVGLAVGSGCGLVNGILITAGRLPPFIATLAMLSAARGLALVVSGGEPISLFPNWFQSIETYDFFQLIPAAVVLVVAMYVLGAAWLRYRPSGRSLFALGGNEEVARLSGISVTRLKLKVYTVAGLLSGVGGLLLASRLNSAQPTSGTGYELQAIAAVVIGGASLAGGEGSVVGTMVGVLIIGILTNGLTLKDVSPFWQQVVIGTVIAGAVMTDTLRRRKA